MSAEFTIPRKTVKPFSKLRGKDPDGLLPRERMFVEEYLVTLSGAASARNVGIKPENAAQQALDWLKRDDVWAAIDKGMQARVKRLRKKQDKVLRELMLLVFSDVTHYTRGQANRLEVVAGVDPKVTRAVARVKFKDRYYTDKEGEEHAEHEMELALYDKNAAIGRAMRHLGIEYGDGRTNNGNPNMKPGGPDAEEDGLGDTLVITEVAE